MIVLAQIKVFSLIEQIMGLIFFSPLFDKTNIDFFIILQANAMKILNLNAHPEKERVFQNNLYETEMRIAQMVLMNTVR